MIQKYLTEVIMNVYTKFNGMSYPILFFIFITIFTSIKPLNLSARSLDEILKSKEIRICGAGSTAKINQNIAKGFVKSLSGDINGRYIKLSKWNQQFINSEEKVVQGKHYS